MTWFPWNKPFQWHLGWARDSFARSGANVYPKGNECRHGANTEVWGPGLMLERSGLPPTKRCCRGLLAQ
jgi:hypothetical protein